GGERVPAGGPALLVANHPNSLLDPAMVVAVAGRPVRFLAKAPLSDDPAVGWLVRGAGAIPVYRQQDDPARMTANEDTFRAAHAALAGGDALGIFPEGLSHTAPSLAPLKTGAARIALGAARLAGGSFPVVPVGLVFRRKERFRSEALAVVGDPVPWDDLAGAGPEDQAAVRELTRRIDEALRDVTVNVERWEDAPLVETAEEVFAAEHGLAGDPLERVERQAEAAVILARVRRDDHAAWRDLAREVARHARVLRALGLRPADLHRDLRVGTAAGWLARRLAFFLLGVPLAAAGAAVYHLPYRLTGVLEERARKEQDVRATFKLLVGAVAHLAWTLLLAGAAGLALGWWWGMAALLLLPPLGLLTVAVRNRWDGALEDARRYLLLRRRRGDLLPELRARQRGIAGRLGALRSELAET
ncbi:MAG TPA: lysophospholipid acyltransferase family protein, partial [Longimicrobiaceae bacterium]|nr:lysophospholipid acyltransferase family protein [Longimicrobiaceae bacterium]